MLSEKRSALDLVADEFKKFRHGRQSRGMKYPPKLRKRLLQTIDDGADIDLALKAVGIAGATLARWRRQQGKKALKRARLPILLPANIGRI